MKNTFMIFAAFFGIFFLISCQSTSVHELSLQQYALRIDSVALHQKFKENPSPELKNKISENQKMLTRVDGLLIDIDPLPPFPPGPKPPSGPCFDKNCFFPIRSVDRILVSKNVKDFSFVIKNKNGEIVGKIGDPQNSKEEDAVSYPIKLTGKDGMTAEISKTSDHFGGKITYEIPVGE